MSAHHDYEARLDELKSQASSAENTQEFVSIGVKHLLLKLFHEYFDEYGDQELIWLLLNIEQLVIDLQNEILDRDEREEVK